MTSVRFRLLPTPAQEVVLTRHCADARFVWNLALEQRSLYRLRLTPSPGYAEQSRQLTEARAENAWLAEGSAVVQHQALRDLEQAFRSFFRRTHRYPRWRKRGGAEGFRIVGVKPEYVRRLNRRTGTVYVAKAGWVRFRWSRNPGYAKSFRVTRDSSGRWHIAFATIPPPVPAPGNGGGVGIDLGIVATVTTSDGDTFHAPTARPRERERLVQLQRRLARAQRGSNRRARVRHALARLWALETDRRKDWIEKTTTDIARRYDTAMVEDLRVRAMTQSGGRRKAALNRSILAQGWSRFVVRLTEKMPGRVQRVNPRHTSQRCSACGHVASESRESQAAFRCVACGFACNADLNAARNIAVGQTVTARGDRRCKRRSMNREPQRPAECRGAVGIPGLAAVEDANIGGIDHQLRR